MSYHEEKLAILADATTILQRLMEDLQERERVAARMNISNAAEGLAINMIEGIKMQAKECEARLLIDSVGKDFLEKLPVKPDSFVYMNFHRALQELFFKRNMILL